MREGRLEIIYIFLFPTWFFRINWNEVLTSWYWTIVLVPEARWVYKQAGRGTLQVSKQLHPHLLGSGGVNWRGRNARRSSPCDEVKIRKNKGDLFDTHHTIQMCYRPPQRHSNIKPGRTLDSKGRQRGPLASISLITWPMRRAQSADLSPNSTDGGSHVFFPLFPRRLWEAGCSSLQHP